MNNSERFEKIFIDFEVETKKKLSNKELPLEKCITILKDKRYNPYFREYDFIEFCRTIRNIKFHSNDDIYFYLTDETIKKLEDILEEVRHPFMVLSKSVRDNIYSATLSSSVKEVMQEMNKHNYTHIPIYDDKNHKLMGIFSEYSLYEYILNNEIVLIDNKTNFAQIIDYIKVDKVKERVLFETRNALYDDVLNKFIKKYKEKIS